MSNRQTTRFSSLKDMPLDEGDKQARQDLKKDNYCLYSYDEMSRIQQQQLELKKANKQKILSKVHESQPKTVNEDYAPIGQEESRQGERSKIFLYNETLKIIKSKNSQNYDSEYVG